jgi:hypothetical protein
MLSLFAYLSIKQADEYLSLWWYLTKKIVTSNWYIIGVLMLVTSLSLTALSQIVYRVVSYSISPKKVTTKSNAVTLMDVYSTVQRTSWLPHEANSISKAAHTVVQQAHLPVACTIAGSTPVPAIRSIMERRNIQKLHLKLADIAPDMVMKVSGVIYQRLRLLNSLTECTIDNFEKLNAATVKGLLERMPNTLHTLKLHRLANDNKSDFMRFETVKCPSSVKHLSMSCTSFRMIMPEGLETLHVSSCHMTAWEKLPSTLLELYVVDLTRLPVLPHGLRVLHLSCVNDVRVGLLLGIDLKFDGAIPDTVTHLKLPETQTRLVPQWPPRLQVLDVGEQYSHPLGDLPDTLKELYVKLDRRIVCDYEIGDIPLPEGLKVLDVAQVKCHVNKLPQGLEVLRLDNALQRLGFVLTEPDVFPPLLKELKICGYNYNVLSGVLPSTLEVLDLGLAYSFSEVPKNSMLPLSLRMIYLCNEYRFQRLLAKLRPSIEIQYVSPRFKLVDRVVY